MNEQLIEAPVTVDPTVVNSEENLTVPQQVDSTEPTSTELPVPFLQNNVGAYRQALVEKMADNYTPFSETLVASQQLGNPLIWGLEFISRDKSVDNTWDPASIIDNEKYKDLSTTQKMYILNNARSEAAADAIVDRWNATALYTEKANSTTGTVFKWLGLIAGGIGTSLTTGAAAGAELATILGASRAAKVFAGTASTVGKRVILGAGEGAAFTAVMAKNEEKDASALEYAVSIAASAGLHAWLGKIDTGVTSTGALNASSTGVPITEGVPVPVSPLSEAESLAAAVNITDTAIAQGKSVTVGEIMAKTESGLAEVNSIRATATSELTAIDDALKALDEQIAATESAVKVVDDEANLAAKEYESKLTEYLANPKTPENFRRVFDNKLSSIFADVVGPGVKTAKAADEVIEEVGIDTLKASAKQFDEATKGTISKLNKLLPEEAKAAGVDVSTLTTKKAIRELFKDADKATKKSANALIDELAVAQRASKVAKEGLSKADSIKAASAVEDSKLKALVKQKEELLARKSRVTESLDDAAKTESELLKVKSANAGKAADDLADVWEMRAKNFKESFMRKLETAESMQGLSAVGKTITQRLDAIDPNSILYPQMFMDDLVAIKAVSEGDAEMVEILSHSLAPKSSVRPGVMSSADIASTVVTDSVAPGIKGDTALMTLGDRLHSTGNEVVNEAMSIVVTGTRPRVDKGVIKTGADYYHTMYFQKYKSAIQEEFNEGFKEFLKNRGKKFKFAWMHQSHASYDSFVERVGDLAHKIDGNPGIVANYDKEVVRVVKGLQKVISDARQEAVRLNLASGVVEDLTKAAFPRVPRYAKFLDANVTFGADAASKLFELAIVKAQPTINKLFKLKALKAELADDPTNAALKSSIEELEKSIDDVAARGKLTDAEALKIMEEDALSGVTYSSMLGNAYFRNGLSRATGGNVVSRSAVHPQDIITILENASPNVLARMSKSERAVFDAQLANSKNATSGSVDSAMNRLEMDFSAQLQIPVIGDESLVHTVSAVDFLDKNIMSVMVNHVNKISGQLGLAKVGIRGMDEFDNYISAVRSQLSKVNDTNVINRFNSDVAMLRKVFAGEALFDGSGTLYQVNRIAKSLTASKLLSYLVISMGQETANILAMLGLKNTLRSIPGVYNMVDDIAKGGYTAKVMREMGGENMSTIDDYTRGSSNIYEHINENRALGTPTWGEAASTGERTRFIDRLENKANILGHAMSILYKPFDIANRQLAVMAALTDLLGAADGALGGVRYTSNGVSASFPKSRKALEAFKKKREDGSEFIDLREAAKVYPDEVHDVMTSAIRLADRAVLTNRATQMPPFVNSQIFSLLGQFKAWGLNAYNNQLLYNVGAGDSVTALVFASQLATGYLNAVARAAIVSEVTNDDTLFKELTSNPVSASLAALRNTGFFAIPSMVIGTLTSKMFGYDIMNQSSMTGQGITPVALTQASQLLSGFRGILEGAIDGEFTQKDLTDALGAVLPRIMLDFSKLIVRQTDLEEDRPKDRLKLQDIFKAE